MPKRIVESLAECKICHREFLAHYRSGQEPPKTCSLDCKNLSMRENLSRIRDEWKQLKEWKGGNFGPDIDPGDGGYIKLPRPVAFGSYMGNSTDLACQTAKYLGS